jgi:hypothetical protein
VIAAVAAERIPVANRIESGVRSRSPGLDDPDDGYVEYAGFAPATSRILLVREVMKRGRFKRWLEEVRQEDLVLIRQASTLALLRAFGRWQDVTWRRETFALR